MRQVKYVFLLVRVATFLKKNYTILEYKTKGNIMKSFYEENEYIIKKIVSLAVFSVSFYVFFSYLVTFVAPMIFGYLLSVIIRPLVLFFSKRLKFGQSGATVLSLLTMLVAIGIVMGTAISRLVTEATALYDNIAELTYYVENVVIQLEQTLQGVYTIIPDALNHTFYILVDVMVGVVNNMVVFGFRDLGNGLIASVPRVAIAMVLGFVSSYFFSRDRELIYNTLIGLVPENILPSARKIKRKLIAALWGYVKAQLIIMSVVACIGIVGHFVLGTPYGLFLAVVIALVDAIPVFGSGLFYWPWMIISLIAGEHMRLVGLAVIYLATLFTRQFLEPKILGNQIGIHPILTLASIYIGLMVFGVFGIFLGPIFAVIFRTLLFIDKEDVM